MDLFEELERMAQNAASDSGSEVCPDEIARWQRLFCYSQAQAASLIAEQKSDHTRHRISYDYCSWCTQNWRPRATTAMPSHSAEKNLSADSIFPTLGVDSTLPQNRAAFKDTVFEPTQKQFPVMYFFYGTLTNSDVLSWHLGLSEEETPVLRSAKVRGGRLECWSWKYKALFDAPSGDVLSGFAYEVTSEERDNALRAHETDSYKAVRCHISVDGRMVKGCTFRFVGSVGTD